jgi:alpha-L-fucosidase 2
MAASTGTLALPVGLPAESKESDALNAGSLLLWYRQPAKAWIEALPLGNGRLGAMVFGNTENERIQLNEDTVWSGGPYDPTNPAGREALTEIRSLVFAGEYERAHRMFGRTMFGLAIPQMQYQPLGDLWLTFAGHGQVKEYRRQLDLDEAIHTVKYRVGNTVFTREVFSSAADQVIVVRLSADHGGQIAVNAALIAGNFEQRTGDARWDAVPPNELSMRGRAMSDEGIDGQIKYQARLRALAQGGTVIVKEGTLLITAADSVTLLIAAGTSFVNYRNAGGDPAAKNARDLDSAASKPYDELRRRHVAEHQRLFQRVHLNLGSSATAQLPTDERLKSFSKTKDPGLVALYFQFGRYLLMSSSRPGSTPANLQGIWNEKSLPPWGSKYTTNINLQMNYWPAEVSHLPECTEPLFKMIADLVESGSAVAKVNYGAPGWVLHQNTDLWLAAAPMDGPTWGTFATGGAWLCTHLWEHYLFNGDQESLKMLYPPMKGAAQFFLSTMTEDPKRKWLVTCPSMSPEHVPKRPESKPFWDEVTNLHLEGTTICAGPTMDLAILRALFQGCIEASQILDLDAEFRAQLQAAQARIAPLQIGRHGQLQEWLEDWDDPTDHHRHISHLWGLYPGHEITPLKEPALAAAAAKSLRFRGDGGPGWSMAWKVCLWARLLDGEHTFLQLANLLAVVDKDEISYKDGGTYINLMNALPFQLDGNMGATAGIAEMLLQSHAGEIHLLPAIPNAWASGELRGFKARGGFVVDLEWKAGRLTQALIHSNLGRTCRIRTLTKVSRVSAAGDGILFTRPEPHTVEFETVPSKTYTISTQP